MEFAFECAALEQVQTKVRHRFCWLGFLRRYYPNNPTEQMKAAILNKMGMSRPYANSKPLLVEDVSLDPPGPGELLIKIKATGLCHSDLSVINGDRPRPMPMVLGHEAAGEVQECGAFVTDLKPGDQVVLRPPGRGTDRCCGNHRHRYQSGQAGGCVASWSNQNAEGWTRGS